MARWGAGTRHTALTRKAASYVDQARRPMPGRMDVYNLLVRLGIDNVLTPEFLQRVDQTARGRTSRPCRGMPRMAPPP